jgi:VWFA-related protein
MNSKTFRILLFITFSALLVTAQKPSDKDQAETTIKVSTTLVQVPITVFDKKGNPIEGLKKEDFVLKENGKEQQIAVFEEVKGATSAVTRPSLAAGQFTNQLIAGNEQRNVMLFAIDGVNTTPEFQIWGRLQLAHYLSRNVTPGALVGLYYITSTGVRVIHDLTSDSTRLVEELKNFKPDSNAVRASEPNVRELLPAASPLANFDPAPMADFSDSGTPEFALMQDNVRKTEIFESLRVLARSVAGVPGRKSLVILTFGLPFNYDGVDRNSRFHWQLERMYRDLNEANVSIYPVPLQGLPVDSPYATTAKYVPAKNQGTAVTRAQEMRPNMAMDRTGTAALAGRMAQMDAPNEYSSKDAATSAARMTGGKDCPELNDLGPCMEQVIKDSSSYYMLGYYIQPPKGDKQEIRKLQVKIDRDGKISYRPEVYLMPPKEANAGLPWPDANFAGLSKLTFTEVPLTVNWYPQPNASSDFQIAIPGSVVKLNDKNQVSLDFMAIVRDSRGKIVDMVHEILQGDVSNVQSFRTRNTIYNAKLKPLAGAGNVRFVAVDQLSRKVGTVDVPFKDGKVVPKS